MDMKSLYLVLLATATVPASSWASQCNPPNKYDLHFGKYYRVRGKISIVKTSYAYMCNIIT